jgi:hypothetical protein
LALNGCFGTTVFSDLMDNLSQVSRIQYCLLMIANAALAAASSASIWQPFPYRWVIELLRGIGIVCQMTAYKTRPITKLRERTRADEKVL